MLVRHPNDEVKGHPLTSSIVVSAYEDATEHLEWIKAGRNEDGTETPADPYMDLFEDSLLLGPVIVRGQYSQGHQAFSSAYAVGDKAALETLKDILLNIQITILANLHKAILKRTKLDYVALLATSDTIVCLAELGERMGRPSCLRRARTVSSSALPLRLMPSPPEQPPTRIRISAGNTTDVSVHVNVSVHTDRTVPQDWCNA